MQQLPLSIIATIAILTAFLGFLVVIKYAVENSFSRTRLTMTAFFLFIVATLTLSFSEFFFATLPYTIPAGIAGVIIGLLVGVRAAEDRVKTEGLMHYMEHFAHIHVKNVSNLTWWSVINFYTVMSALFLINLIGFTTVLLHNLKPMALATSAFGAFLIGSIIPYLYHLWSIRVTQRSNTTISEK